MKLPNAELAIIDIEKIRDYCLNQDHPRGKHKARVFERDLGLTTGETEELIISIKKGIQEAECFEGEGDAYGQRYSVDIRIEKNDVKAYVRTGWIIRRGEIQPRLTTCFVKSRE